MSRVVTLVLVDDDGRVGALPPYPVALPYWPEVTDVVAGARARFGITPTVLRLLSTDRAEPHGGSVTYLAECPDIGSLPIQPIGPAASAHLGGDPRRAAYAERGGPAVTLRWATSALRRHGRVVRAADQQRTWNLSAIWRLVTDDGTVWLKHVPRFLAHEAPVIGWIAEHGHRECVPTLLDADRDGRMLLAEVPGADLYGAGTAVRNTIAERMHGIGVTAAQHVPALLAAGVPDRRAARLAEVVTAVVTEHGVDPRLHRLVTDLDARLAAVAACGLPDTLVHGDLHPGNARGDGTRPVVLDWGDSFVGNPAFDVMRLVEEDLDPGERAAVVDAWAGRWRASVPACDPYTALDLLRPVAALRHAAVFAGFLSEIEPAERPYHAADVSHWLERAADELATGSR